MRKHGNTLYITTDGAYLAKEGEAVLVRVNNQTRLRIPIHTLDGVVCIGRIGLSPAVMSLCAGRDVSVSFLSTSGRFLAKVTGPTTGNVLLRKEQYRASDTDGIATSIARSVVAGKISNSRSVLQRTARDRPNQEGSSDLVSAADRLTGCLRRLERQPGLEEVRGVEGEAAQVYFSVFDRLVTSQDDRLRFDKRSRRPPLNRMNALLSFLYTMLLHDVRSALETVGLDPAVGFLHRDRPGRPGLALDLMEELRSFLADRLALTLVNRKQVQADGFVVTESGGVIMNDATRKTVITAWQGRKAEELQHPFLGETLTVGLIPHIQARLLARHLRGELDAYPPFVWR